MRINNSKLKFKGISPLANPLSVFYNKNAVLPTLFIETGVVGGRSIMANKTGGKIEARERLVEQGTSAAIWLGGVQALKKAGETFGKKVLKLGDLNFDVGFDYLRNPLENVDKKLLAFKTGNILLSTAAATIFIGFGLPKINHFITNKMLAKNKQKEKASVLKPFSLKEYQEYSLNKKKNNISFTSLLDGCKNLAHVIENNSTTRLLITDAGVIGGRYYNARNKYEKIENLFRDISSIYFYLYSTKHIAKLLNKLTSNTDINPQVLDKTVEMLIKKSKEANITGKDFLNQALGAVSKEDLSKISGLFKNSQVVNLEDFVKIFANQSEKAIKISELQPLLNGQSVITKQQAKDILSCGWTSDADFLHSIYNAATKGNYNKKNKFISAEHLAKVRDSVNNFVKQLDNVLKKQGGNLSEELVKKTASKNVLKNFAFYSIGTVVSTFALAVLIPKLQYLIRRKLTNNDEFVGIKKYDN